MSSSNLGRVIKVFWYCYLLFSLLYCFQYYATLWIWPERVGCKSLGNNLYLLDWKDGKPSIVYGTIFMGRLCCDGIPVVPDTLVSFAAEYVTHVEKKDNHLYVETNQYKKHAKGNYIIDLSFNPDSVSVDMIRKEYIHGFTESNEDREHFVPAGTERRW